MPKGQITWSAAVGLKLKRLGMHTQKRLGITVTPVGHGYPTWVSNDTLGRAGPPPTPV